MTRLVKQSAEFHSFYIAAGSGPQKLTFPEVTQPISPPK